ncbi:MAG: TRAP transporter large permease subunit [Anaerolineales bacterium]|nr:TRAP transporter large permease subunit [Anaerolineales bacterium]MCX7755538.1 TRAP transporter large permease subunit [Anaerolineales bacterium]MDW8278423.1 TRAP transporter large permease subunit [Anaerolineales bacterium]
MSHYEWLALVMFFGFFVIIMSGYPVGYSFAATAILFGTIGYFTGSFNLNLVKMMPSRWFGTMSDFTLLAIPFFIFMGAVFERSGLAERLLETIGKMMGRTRGGLALAVVMVGTLLAATTGVVAATIIMMGMITLPTMLKYGYDKRLATGVIVSSGTLAQMIPPSLVLVVLSDQIGVSVGDLFIGSVIPGLLLAGLYFLYVFIITRLKPSLAPDLPPNVMTFSRAELMREVLTVVVPPGLLVFFVLGSIFFGLASPTEAGSIGAVGAVLLAWANKRLNRQMIFEAALATARVTALVMTILFASSLFSLVFTEMGGKRVITEFLTNIPGGKWGFLIVANIAIFLMGIPLEFIEISFIAMPIFVPAAQALGLDMVWLAVVFAINLQTAFISPPVGFSLFYLQSAAPKEVRTIDIHRGALPFVGLQVLALLIVIFFPETVTWLIGLAARSGP